VKKIICFDIDGVICKTEGNNYKKSKPIKSSIKVINSLKKKFYIILFTARFMGRSNQNIGKAKKLAEDLTIKQLKKWGVNYDKIFFGKPSYDYIVDDKAYNFKKNWHKKFNPK
jgi:capsule biosynthesis phosphatase